MPTKTVQRDFKKLMDRMDKALNIWFDPKVEPFDVTLLHDSDTIIYLKENPSKINTSKLILTELLNLQSV